MDYICLENDIFYCYYLLGVLESIKFLEKFIRSMRCQHFILSLFTNLYLMVNPLLLILYTFVF